MATTRLMPLHVGKGRTVAEALGRVTDYVENPEKTNSGNLVSDIFTAQEVGIREIVYYLDFEGREQDFIDFCLEHSDLDTGIVPTVEDRFITLSTCTGQGHDTRWTVQAVLGQAEFDTANILTESEEDQEP